MYRPPGYSHISGAAVLLLQSTQENTRSQTGLYFIYATHRFLPIILFLSPHCNWSARITDTPPAEKTVVFCDKLYFFTPLRFVRFYVNGRGICAFWCTRNPAASSLHTKTPHSSFLVCRAFPRCCFYYRIVQRFVVRYRSIMVSLTWFKAYLPLSSRPAAAKHRNRSGSSSSCRTAAARASRSP